MLPVIKMAAVFALVVLMLQRKINLGVTMMAAALALGLLFGMGLVSIIKQAGLTFADSGTLTLMLALILIMVLESVMRRSGMLGDMTGSIFLLHWNPKVLTAAIPAIIGFLPSAGGARFSAPLVEQAMTGSSYRAEEKVFINYWFRHVWEYSLPLYPGIILAAQLSGVPLGRIILWQWPFTVVWALLGYWLVFRGKKMEICSSTPVQQPLDKRPIVLLISSIWPILATVGLVIAHVPIVLALLAVLAALMAQKKYPLIQVWDTLREPMTAGIVFLIWGTMAFKDILQVSGAVSQVSGIFISSGVPPYAVAIVLPLMAGILTGLVQACIGVSFPLVLGVVEPTAAYVMLAYVSAVVGVMMSPVHLCFILTNDYFQADFFRSYRSLIAPSLLVLAGAVTLFGFASSRGVMAWSLHLLH
ncbi:MAG: hypothetical protein JL50_13385 [Peptococcaceae bacterium BICA1-7]|nr:MAG: hypothetical protein JL50_13385 [Peptococcaceae bacterium BICA1-7]HBV99549.1 DUF401 domain-containing protein [Desulfotomaculum sp.]